MFLVFSNFDFQFLTMTSRGGQYFYRFSSACRLIEYNSSIIVCRSNVYIVFISKINEIFNIFTKKLTTHFWIAKVFWLLKIYIFLCLNLSKFKHFLIVFNGKIINISLQRNHKFFLLHMINVGADECNWENFKFYFNLEH